MLLWLLACSPGLVEIDLGEVPVGAHLDQLVAGAALGEIAGDLNRFEASSFEISAFAPDGETLGLRLVWSPESADQEASLSARPSDGPEYRIYARSIAADPNLPSPLAVSQGTEALDSIASSGLGAADLSGAGYQPFAADPVGGNAWFGDGEQGRAWRLNLFYEHPTWGIWVAGERLTSPDWVTPPDCFESTDGLYQNGGCDGTETELDGTIPRGWRFLHGGFAGDGELVGLSGMAADEVRGRVWMAGAGWLSAIDTDLHISADEDDDPYSFAQRVPGIWREIAGFEAPWLGLAGGQLWLVDQRSGQIAHLNPDGPLVPARGPLWPKLGGALGAVGDAVFVADDQQVFALDPTSGAVLWQRLLPAGLCSGPPIASAAEGGRAAFLWPGALVITDGERLKVVPAPDGASFSGLAYDTVSGGQAATLSLLYVVGQTDGAGWLAALTPDGAWLGQQVLSAPPRALGYAAPAHDLYVLYGAGQEGCDGALAEHCDAGSHPAIVEPLYNPYGLVPPASAGHPLNLFLAPVIETPKDTDLDDDPSGGSCRGLPDTARICCALRFGVEERLIPNIDYLDALTAQIGDEYGGRPPTLVWGINPTVLRAARTCLGDAGFVDIGLEVYNTLGILTGPDASLAHWTHTALDAHDEHQDWFLSLLYTPGLDYSLPVDNQVEYQRLHDGLSAVFLTDDLDDSLAGLDLQAAVGAGNAFDGEGMIDDGWPDGSWVAAIRDGPLASGGEARRAFYFLSAGADPEIGAGTSRKKELWPLDLRERAAVRGLSEDPLLLDDDVSDALLNLPGMSWHLAALPVISDSGAFLESLKSPTAVDARSWDLVLRYLRRVAASGDPAATKSWYQHILDLTSAYGLITENSAVTADSDINLDGLRRIQELLVEPGYARWALPDEIIDEHQMARPSTP